MIILHRLLLWLAMNSCVILTHTSFLPNRARIILLIRRYTMIEYIIILQLHWRGERAPGKQKRQRTTTVTWREKPTPIVWPEVTSSSSIVRQVPVRCHRRIPRTIIYEAGFTAASCVVSGRVVQIVLWLDISFLVTCNNQVETEDTNNWLLFDF